MTMAFINNSVQGVGGVTVLFSRFHVLFLFFLGACVLLFVCLSQG